MRTHMVIYRDQWVFLDYLPVTDALNSWWLVRVGDGTHGNRAGFTHSNSETHMTVICDAMLISGRGGLHGYLYAVQL